ncbi:hypothetical protein T4D_853 [Trichinella pseudospiralis]|uniref:Uncharacterized protein n=1 Tax=Trichinella pseudospiralis TaxID=6337 RepID=A0A0V1FEF5_TRIPS|nr:hypothetical protein T4D_853 [Trichinella pseudospiralis]
MLKQPVTPGLTSSGRILTIRTGRPLKVANTSRCRKKLHPSYCKTEKNIKWILKTLLFVCFAAKAHEGLARIEKVN